jgi:hypothetical protein
MHIRTSPSLRHRTGHSRGVTPILATILLVGLTVVTATVLYAFQPRYPGVPLQVTYYEGYNEVPITVYGEDNGPGSNQCPAPAHICTMNGSTVTVTTIESSHPIPYSQIQVVFLCAGINVLSGFLSSIMDPTNNTGQGNSINDAPSCPTPANPPTCINKPAVGVALIRLVYFVPLSAKETTLTPGDTFYLYGFSCHVNVDSTAGDDAYGPPSICATIGKCNLIVYVNGEVSGPLLSIPISL